MQLEILEKNNYETFIEINFALQPQFKTIFEDGFGS